MHAKCKLFQMITLSHYVIQREYNRDMTIKTSNPEWTRTLTMTEAEEAVLVSIARYFVEMGLPEDINETDFDTLVDKICEPSPFDYSVTE